MGLQKTLALSAVAWNHVELIRLRRPAPLLSSSEPMTIAPAITAAKETLTDFPLMEAVKSSIRRWTGTARSNKSNRGAPLTAEA